MTRARQVGAAASGALTGEAMLRLRHASLRFGPRMLWSDLDLSIAAGEFVAVLGTNGSGKSSLLKAVLGLQPLTAGAIELLGNPVRRGDRRIGYVPQQKLADDGTPLRGRDLVGLGLDGHRYGFALPTPRRRAEIDRLLAAVGAGGFAGSPLAKLSGGEQQRLRIAQALADEPSLLLCDEPLLSLDLSNQRMVSELVDRARQDRPLGVLFVTHDINPVLEMVDRVLYLAEGQFRIGRPEEVLRSDVLSSLYGTPVDVIRTRGRVVVIGAPDSPHHQREGLRTGPGVGL